MSQTPSSYYQTERTDEIAVVTVLDSNLLCDQHDAFYALADELGSDSVCRNVVLSLENLQSVKSIMLGVLINFQKRLKDQGKGLKISQVDPDVMRIFQLTKMDQIFDIQSSTADAIKSFHGKPSAGWISKVFGGFGKS